MKPKIRRLIWDIETSPNVVYSWRVGFNLSISPDNIVEERAIVCIGYKWQGEKSVHSFKWRGRGDDRKMLLDFIPILESADEAVAHYGDRFDLPWVRARAAFHGIPMSPYIKTVDTKAQSSRGFYFNSNKLDYLGQFLGLGKKIETDYKLWTDVMDGDEAALERMVTYCKQDVRLLEQVYLRLESYNKPKTHVGVLNGNAKWSCPGCGSENTIRTLDVVTGAGTRQARMKCKDCNFIFKTTDAEARRGAAAKNISDKQCSQCFEWLPEDTENFRFLTKRQRYLAECRPCERKRKVA